MLAANSFTEIAKRITPKTLLIIPIPLGPMRRSIVEEVFKTM
jgi:hypothetical protein